jgi:hypothetical protein
MNAPPVNMSAPAAMPWIGRAALWLCAPSEDAEAIAGDLAEEYFGDRLARMGPWRANRWYVSQAVRSAVPLLMSRWRRGELAGLVAAAMVTILAPLRLADLLWVFVHSHVPLKADLTWSAGIWIANVVIAACGAAILGYGARTLRSAVTLAILALACAGVSVVMSAGRVPAWYIVTLSMVTSILIPCGFLLRMRRVNGAGGEAS